MKKKWRTRREPKMKKRKTNRIDVKQWKESKLWLKGIFSIHPFCGWKGNPNLGFLKVSPPKGVPGSLAFSIRLSARRFVCLGVWEKKERFGFFQKRKEVFRRIWKWRLLESADPIKRSFSPTWDVQQKGCVCAFEQSLFLEKFSFSPNNNRDIWKKPHLSLIGAQLVSTLWINSFLFRCFENENDWELNSYFFFQVTCSISVAKFLCGVS